MLWQALPLLRDYYGKDLGRSEEVVQARVPVAIGRLLGRGDTLTNGQTGILDLL